jgi:hypothetical protein
VDNPGDWVIWTGIFTILAWREQEHRKGPEFLLGRVNLDFKFSQKWLIGGFLSGDLVIGQGIYLFVLPEVYIFHSNWKFIILDPIHDTFPVIPKQVQTELVPCTSTLPAD